MMCVCVCFEGMQRTRRGKRSAFQTRGSEPRMKREKLNSEIGKKYQCGNDLSSLTEQPYKLIYKTVIGCSTPPHNIMQYTQQRCIQT